MKDSQSKIQLRFESGKLEFYNTLAAATEAARRDPRVWKISWTMPTGERCRLVRKGDEFVLGLMKEEVEKELVERGLPKNEIQEMVRGL